MPERALHTLVEGGSFFEGPRWHDGRWWASDFYRQLIVVATPDGKEEHVETAFQPSGLGWLPDGRLLVVSMKDHRIMRRDDGAFSIHADVTEHCGGHLNDMVVDERGRAYVGNFGFDLMAGGAPTSATLVRVDPDGTATVVADELLFPNGAVITPDGRTLVVGETFGGRYTAFTIADDGSLSDRRVWGQISRASTDDPGAGGVGVAPDGCTLDAEGHIWAADALGNRCVRIAAGGDIVDEIAMPDGLGVFACMLGGDDGRTLLMCAAPDFLEHNRMNAREAVLLTTTVDVPHAGLP
ncbi:MAG TPA: SMP-30/gluconolactonase/LRE family protein [Acidimicrobiales bacterium]|nr:SMP-30/gluconolactonase/LRE family protein [Acidimicrobiales bacterium]